MGLIWAAKMEPQGESVLFGRKSYWGGLIQGRGLPKPMLASVMANSCFFLKFLHPGEVAAIKVGTGARMANLMRTLGSVMVMHQRCPDAPGYSLLNCSSGQPGGLRNCWELPVVPGAS